MKIDHYSLENRMPLDKAKNVRLNRGSLMSLNHNSANATRPKFKNVMKCNIYEVKEDVVEEEKKVEE